MGEGLKRVAKMRGGLIAKSGNCEIAHPPPADAGLQNIIHHVRVPKGKRVRWIMTHTDGGSFVSGYEFV